MGKGEVIRKNRCLISQKYLSQKQEQKKRRGYIATEKGAEIGHHGMKSIIYGHLNGFNRFGLLIYDSKGLTLYGIPQNFLKIYFGT